MTSTLARGLAPDECYYIANAPQVAGRDHIDLRTDPPPDLAIEVDVTSSSLNRMGIYAALAVPEVWRLDGPALTFHVPGPGGRDLCPPGSHDGGQSPGNLPPLGSISTRIATTSMAVRFRSVIPMGCPALAWSATR